VEENISYELENMGDVLSDHEELLIYLDDLLVDNGAKKHKSEMSSLDPINEPK